MWQFRGDQATFTLLHEQLMGGRSTLTEREQGVPPEVFRMTASRNILEEVGRQFHVTGERIRQIEAKALCVIAPSEPQQKVKGLSGLAPERIEKKKERKIR